MLRIQSEFVDGFGTLAELGRRSVFSVLPGSTAMIRSTRWPRRLATKLVGAGLSVITGGGPGVMEAANKGAAAAGGVSVGLGIELPFESGLNPYVNLGINFRYFFAHNHVRQVRPGFVVMPGGYGTFDELFEALTSSRPARSRPFRSLWEPTTGAASWTGCAPGPPRGAMSRRPTWSCSTSPMI